MAEIDIKDAPDRKGAFIWEAKIPALGAAEPQVFRDRIAYNSAEEAREAANRHHRQGFSQLS
jgi:hypothetical protein